MYRIILLITIIFLVCFSFDLKADQIRVVGWAVDERNNPLRDAIINIYESDRKVDELDVNRRGRFIASLDINKDYVIEITAPGMIGKKFAFDTDIPSSAESSRGLGFELAVDLFEGFPGAEIELFEDPLLNIFYDPVLNSFYFNEEEYDRVIIEIEEARDYILELNDRKEIFDDIIELADNSYEQGDYEDAYEYYSQAVDLDMPGETYAAEQKNMLARQLGIPTEEDIRYDEKIAQADSKFEIKEFEEAIDYYEEALEIKPDEQYPYEQIDYCEALLAEEKKAAEAAVAAEEAAAAEEEIIDDLMAENDIEEIPDDKDDFDITQVDAHQEEDTPDDKQEERYVAESIDEKKTDTKHRVVERVEPERETEVVKDIEKTGTITRPTRQTTKADLERVELNVEQIEQINEKALFLQQNPDRNLVIHSMVNSNEADKKLDFYLSKYQASLVIGYMQGMGIEAGRIYPVFYSDFNNNNIQDNGGLRFEIKSNEEFQRIVNSSNKRSLRYLDDLSKEPVFDPKVEFLVQFTAVADPVAPDYYAEILDNLSDKSIYYYFSDKWLHHYAVGNIYYLSEAMTIHRMLRNMGYDTYILTLSDGKRIFTTEISEVNNSNR